MVSQGKIVSFKYLQLQNEKTRKKKKDKTIKENFQIAFILSCPNVADAMKMER